MECTKIILLAVLFGMESVSTQGNRTSDVLLLAEFKNSKLYSLDMQTKTLQTLPVCDVSMPLRFSYDAKEDIIYWNDRGDYVKKMNSDYTNVKIVVKAKGYIRGIAIDSTERLIVYSDHDGIYKTKIGTTDVTQIVQTVYTWAIVLDTSDKKIYWTAIFNYSIYSVNYDGSQFQPIVTNLTHPPYALAIDSYDKVLYWAERGMITKSNTDGSHKQVLYRDSLTMEIYDLALYKGNTLVFAIRNSSSRYIYTLPTTGGHLSTFGPPVSENIYGVLIISRKEILCPPLQLDSNTNVLYSNGTYNGSTASFYCTEGYYLQEKYALICQGWNWSGEVPTCQKVHYPIPLQISNENCKCAAAIGGLSAAVVLLFVTVTVLVIQKLRFQSGLVPDCGICCACKKKEEPSFYTNLQQAHSRERNEYDIAMESSPSDQPRAEPNPTQQQNCGEYINTSIKQRY